MKNVDHLIDRQRSGHFVAYHPITRKKIATYDTFFEAWNAIQSILKATP